MIVPSGAALPDVGRTLCSTPRPACSSNWSGYAVTGVTGAFHSVSASWIQPAAHCVRVAGHRYAAFWVGLDGVAPSMTVEQTGTDSDCRGPNPTYYGWYEMFPAPPVFFRTAVRAGDHISASVTFRGTTTFVLVLRDSTRHWTHTITKNAADAARSSAEVITEAPATGTGSILPLADFGTIRYTGSSVDGTLLRRLAPIRIVMVGGPPLHLKDNTSLIGMADVFTNTWIRSN